MPLVEVTLGAGRSPHAVRTMIHEVHEVVSRTLGARSDHVRIIVREVPRTHWATGDVTLAEMDARSQPPGPDDPTDNTDTNIDTERQTP